MLYIVLGCLGFVFLYIFDLNKVINLHNYFNLFFASGFLLLVFSTVLILLNAPADFKTTAGLQTIYALLAALFLALLFYALFIALPFTKTYLQLSKQYPLVNTGMYALCRHPGVIWFGFLYLFLFLASGKTMMLWAGLIWTVMDIIHVYVQDRWLFPKTIEGYADYQKTTPFLVPDFGRLYQMTLRAARGN
jgi:protein-S-isoprenylcysteine O-methyltransferase Ste14